MSAKIMLYIGGVAFIIIVCAGIYFKGVSDGKGKQMAVQATAERNAVTETRSIEKVIMRMPKNEVQNRLEQKWCRDCL